MILDRSCSNGPLTALKCLLCYVSNFSISRVGERFYHRQLCHPDGKAWSPSHYKTLLPLIQKLYVAACPCQRKSCNLELCGLWSNQPRCPSPTLHHTPQDQRRFSISRHPRPLAKCAPWKILIALQLHNAATLPRGFLQFVNSWYVYQTIVTWTLNWTKETVRAWRLELSWTASGSNTASNFNQQFSEAHVHRRLFRFVIEDGGFSRQTYSTLPLTNLILQVILNCWIPSRFL